MTLSQAAIFHVGNGHVLLVLSLVTLLAEKFIMHTYWAK